VPGERARVPHIPQQEPHSAQEAKQRTSTYHAAICAHFDLYKQVNISSTPAMQNVMR